MYNNQWYGRRQLSQLATMEGLADDQLKDILNLLIEDGRIEEGQAPTGAIEYRAIR